MLALFSEAVCSRQLMFYIFYWCSKILAKIILSGTRFPVLVSKKPGKGTLYTKAILTDEEIEIIKTELLYTDRIDRVYYLDLIDEVGDICASVEKTIHIQNKQSNSNI